MFLRLDDEQQEIRDLVRKFAQQEIAPHAEQWDEESHFPREIFPPLAELGLAGMLVPEEYGGAQLSRLTGAVIYEQIGQADMSTAVWLAVHNMVSGLIAKFGDEEQRQRWLPRWQRVSRWARLRSARRTLAPMPPASAAGAARRGQLYPQWLQVLGDERGRGRCLRRDGHAPIPTLARAASPRSSSRKRRPASASASWSARWGCTPAPPAN